MAAVEQQQQPATSPFTPPSSPLSPSSSSPVIVRSPSPSLYDVFPIVCEDPPIRALSGSQYYLIHEAYHSTALPNDTLFPWLHGVDGTNLVQNNFFGIQECLMPLHRGVTVVQAEETSKSLLVGSVYPSDIFNPLPNDGDDSRHGRRGFLKVNDGEGVNVNLRNFKIQVSKYVTLSDIVVYGENGLNDTVLEIAKQAAWAQQALRENSTNGIDYEVFVILDPFSFFEKEFPELVALDSHGITRNKVNFLEKEREEMRLLTAASEISHNVWLGNTQDVPVSSDMDPADSAISLIDDNPRQFSICIESHDLAEMADQTTLKLATEQLASLSTCRRTSIDEIIHIDSFDAIATRLIDLCEFISTQANKFDHKILIHCADGYTETSLLSLTYLMFNENLKLPQAYLRLQKTRNEKKDIENIEKFPWFFSPFFEGSFPSRILPFLYLGNLNHACNDGMLKALGITHVLSVGEDSKLDRKEFEVQYLDNLYDDGIDSLWNHLDSCVNFIENARRSNGSILIHCRVGVSRSATITIAYIMKHLGRSLVSSYLYVRARRLNVIIQPNLKFMYELLQYEQKLTGRMNINWVWLAKEIHALNMCYVGA
ncbi:13851_t:CDS:2 [Funneliformis caledonium]|uniref:13851_t:CDS:1 n=1 Tax=Funneliformis caledonium TaxID=1117310 RepID=A0A9N8VT14_9GLOM|nr:13851_t:CDS:2 [Funneliformis caledonium]